MFWAGVSRKLRFDLADLDLRNTAGGAGASAGASTVSVSPDFTAFELDHIADRIAGVAGTSSTTATATATASGGGGAAAGGAQTQTQPASASAPSVSVIDRVETDNVTLAVGDLRRGAVKIIDCAGKLISDAESGLL